MAALKKRQNPLINMDRSTIDPNYRYKFEKLNIKSEGKNTGKRTVISNIVSIANGILGTKMSTKERYNDDIVHKTAKHIAQFIGKKLGGQCQYKRSRKVAIISGVHSQHSLQCIIYDYVEQYALCPQCDLPELTPAIESSAHCKSCGECVNHNNTYKQSKRGYKGQKKKKKQKKHNRDRNCIEDEVKVDIKHPIHVLNTYLMGNKNVSSSDIMEKIKVLSIAHKLDRKEQIKMVIYVLMEYEDNDYKLMIESIKKYKDIFETFNMVKKDTKIFISYIEEIIVRKCVGDDLLNHSYAIFSCLYDEDILDEDDIKEWYQCVDAEYDIIYQNELQLIKDKASPFVKWLENTDND